MAHQEGVIPSPHLKSLQDSDSFRHRQCQNDEKAEPFHNLENVGTLFTSSDTYYSLRTSPVNDNCQCLSHDCDNCEISATLTAFGRTFGAEYETLVRGAHTVKEGHLRSPRACWHRWEHAPPWLEDMARSCIVICSSSMLITGFPAHILSCYTLTCNFQIKKKKNRVQTYKQKVGRNTIAQRGSQSAHRRTCLHAFPAEWWSSPHSVPRE